MDNQVLDFGKLTDDPAKSCTLPAKFYFDDQIWAKEKRDIFYRSWNYVTATANLSEPGSYITVQIADQSIVVVRGKDKQLRAFYNVCSHRAHELLQGQGKVSAITCPYHAWTYDLAGKLRTNPSLKALSDFEVSEFCLKTVAIEEFCGFVFVNLDPNASPLASQYPGLEAEIRSYSPHPEKLVFAKRLTYELKANWKNVVDNFLECYHCPPAHPAFVELVDHDQYTVTTHSRHITQLSPIRAEDNSAYKVRRGDGCEVPKYAGFWIWPNVAFNVFPGQPNMTIFHFIPTGPETTLEYFDFYLMSDTPDKEAQEFIDYIDNVLQVEDINLVESVQKGLHSRGYQQGRFVHNAEVTSMSEHGVHKFHTLVKEALSSDL
ncbi:aromatic ring-hydroxylating oxygenase subunit alpha [Hyphomicrobium facile]|uniref:Choline monooxygenase n=1 Tax=Hyphomicrobium facile TaxID=51670 RepID=A0A1I7NDW0_9HYPH|nr:aromatic ring-hydroxylating dioxygenase subunit alpha [Hyphomicrobium facile]SFV32839.1 choline monooxygenase [Hyphomicrobium facile]